MAGITLAVAQAHLEQWLQADSAVSNNQEYTFASGLRVRKADAGMITEKIEYWGAKVDELSRGGAGRFYQAVPR